MYFPKLPYSSNNKTKKSVIEFKGLNKKELIADNELSATVNISSDQLPLLSPRSSRATSYTLTAGKALFAATKLAWVDSVTFTSLVNDITFGAHTISSASSKFSGIAVGDTLVITGCTVNAANNATVIVTTATAAMITCSATTFTITNGDPAGRETAAITFTGCSFKYDNVTKGAVTASAKSMVELSQRIVIFPDKVSYDTVGGTFAAFGTGTYPAAGSAPDIDYACTLDNRIWAVKGDDIYCCALGDFDDWTTFLNPDGTVNDAGAWQVDTGTNGDFTGIATYKKNHNLAFKKDGVWKRFGSVPSDFQFIGISELGCVSNKSIKEVNNTLFWLSPQGVVAYTGGVPEVISENLNDNYVSAVAGGDGRKYYISLYNGSTYALYVYDTWKGIWIQEDTLQAVSFAFFDGYLYALAIDNNVWKFNSGTESVSWSFESKIYDEQYMGKKAHSELSCRVDLEVGSILNVYIKIDNGSYTLVKSYSTTDLTSFIIPLKVKKGDHFQLKFTGTGDFTLYQIQRKYIYGEAD